MAGDGPPLDRNQWHDIDIKARNNNNYNNSNYSNLNGDNPTAEQQTVAVQVISGLGLQCPRCESSNTKFCYFNNYNRTQPRHFCKSCRRYWTHGGSLRTVPIGGGCRRSSCSAKRSADSDGHGASYKCTNKNKRLCCSVASPKTTTNTQLAALAADNNLGPIRHLSALPQPFPAASMLTCTPNPFPPAHSSSIPFAAPGFNGNLETSAFFDTDSETFPLFHSSSPSEEDQLSALSSSENIPTHSYLQDQLGLAMDVNHFSPHFQHYNIHDEPPLDALLTKGTPFTSWSTAEGQDLFDAHHHPAYCYGNNSWMMPAEFQAQSIAHSTLI